MFTKRMFNRTVTPWNLLTDMKLIGWFSTLACVLLVLIPLIVSYTLQVRTGNTSYYRRVIETVVPLVFSLQAAFLLSPDNEPTMELLLSFPTPLARLFVRRLMVLCIPFGVIAMAASLVAIVIPGIESLGLAIMRWLSVSVILGGVAVFTTLLTRHGVFGALVVVILWMGSLYGGDSLLRVWPRLWLLHIYLQPQDLDLISYFINRVLLILIGLGLVFLSTRLLWDLEHMMGIKR